MTTPAGRWQSALHLTPLEIEALNAGKRVTRTYPEPLPNEPPQLSPEDFEAMKGGMHVMKTFSPTHFLQVGDIVAVAPSERPRPPPPLLPEELEAIRSGETLRKRTTQTSARASPHPVALPNLRVRVVEYRHEGPGHSYSFDRV